jgi:hypothetical protein
MHSPLSQRSYFEIYHLNHQAGCGDLDDFVHFYSAVGQSLAVTLLEFQNPRDDHVNAAKIPACHLVDLLNHFIGRFLRIYM